MPVLKILSSTVRSGKVQRTFLDILQSLNAGRVRYLVAGGIAVTVHGIDRSTHDLDLYVDLAPANLRRAITTLSGLGYRPTIPVSAEEIVDAEVRARWIRNRNVKVLGMVDPRDPLHPVDVFVIHPIPFRDAWKRREVKSAGGVRVPLLSVADLIRLKKIAGREQDLSDIISLRQLKRGKT